ncbi:MAG: nitrate reductase subunit beta [Desulfopila sp.]
MKIKAQLSMVINLDKCIGCHTCSIPCKNVWTTRKGAEYMWFNNVETKPGIGYPRQWENQELHRGGWQIAQSDQTGSSARANRKASSEGDRACGGAAGREKERLQLKAGGRLRKMTRIFHNPDLPGLDDYYEPWEYDYQNLITAPERRHQPGLRPRSQLTGEEMEVTWGPNWEDDLAGVCETGKGDVNFAGIDQAVYLSFCKVFMFYLPRLCEHCLNPACVASCPSGAMYKRDEDGIVLVDQERCRGWRYCVSACPYKKVYFNWQTGRSEKCLFCYPRIESGQTPLCAHSCVGRVRYVGVILYDGDRLREAASVTAERDLYPAQLDLLLDPTNPAVIAAASRQGIAGQVLEAAGRSPIYPLVKTWRLALPLHPEYRTLPMVWYIPPLSPVEAVCDDLDIAATIDSLRIPVRYLANLLTAGDEEPVRRALKCLAAMRAFMRSTRLGQAPEAALAASGGFTEETMVKIYELLALARHQDRFVVPSSLYPDNRSLHRLQGCTGFAEYR